MTCRSVFGLAGVGTHVRGDYVTEPETREAIERSEVRKGTQMQAEVGLPGGFIPPSAALAPSSAEPIIATSASGQADVSRAAERER
jgi:hypothetical protein